MELGISSLGDIIDFGLSNKWKNVDDLLSKSTEACLNFAEEQDIAVVEIVIDPQNIFINEIKQKFVDLMSSYSMKKQVHGPFIDVNLCSHNNSISQAYKQMRLYETTIFTKHLHFFNLSITALIFFAFCSA